MCRCDKESIKQWVGRVLLVVPEVLGAGLVSAWPQDAEYLVGGDGVRSGQRELPGADAVGDRPSIDLEAQLLLCLVPGQQHAEGKFVG